MAESSAPSKDGDAAPRPAVEHAVNSEVYGTDTIESLRAKHMLAAQSTSYTDHLHIVKGEKQYLFDPKGARYLDCVNNVCHVGHSHPRVFHAAVSQLAQLNTNTRYLHENWVKYAEELTATFPQHSDPDKSLSVCVFVCSGTEANDVALRMARAYTKRRDVIVIDVAYHGNSTAMIDISPYKYNGRGGAGRPEHVQCVDTPDLYRGRYQSDDPEAVDKYLQQIDAAITACTERGHGGVAAFYAEALMGCAGQMPLPPGYLKQAFEKVHAAGGVCVSDEVQIGFGRVGSHFWGFESMDALPDIVTMGKPIGNGFPMAAIVTTPEIARAFSNGMEFFNTFGGNPVSMAVGRAVLDVIREERLQENAETVGNYFIRELRALQDKHDLIGDVRGAGLFIGAELVRDRVAKTPARQEAKWIADRLRHRRVLLSTDGKDVNVIKVKPPMCFTTANVDEVVCCLDEALGEVVKYSPADLPRADTGLAVTKG